MARRWKRLYLCLDHFDGCKPWFILVNAMTLRLSDPSMHLPAILVFLQDWKDVLSSVWHYLNDPHQIGNIEVRSLLFLKGRWSLSLPCYCRERLASCSKGGLPRGLISIPGCATQLPDWPNT